MESQQPPRSNSCAGDTQSTHHSRNQRSDVLQIDSDSAASDYKDNEPSSEAIEEETASTERSKADHYSTDWQILEGELTIILSLLEGKFESPH